MQAEFDRFRGIVDAIQIKMFDRSRPVVAVAEDERRARDGIGTAERSHRGRDESRLSRAEIAFERDDVARYERAREGRGDAFECGEIACRNAFSRRHDDTVRRAFTGVAEEVRTANAKGLVMWWRANDVVVGVITGVVSAVVAALFEAFFVTARFLSLGQHGGGLGSKILFIALVGAIVGGIVGFIVGAVIKPRPQPR